MGWERGNVEKGRDTVSGSKSFKLVKLARLEIVLLFFFFLYSLDQ